jgi:hypothetical protein
MSKELYAFLERHIDLYNCGQHDLDNSFLLSDYGQIMKSLKHARDGLVPEFASWSSSHWLCTPIGICPENMHKTPGMRYVAMVFEDDNGNRYFVHVPGYWVDEYKVFDQGEEAMAIARDEFHRRCEEEDYGRPATLTEDEITEAAEQLTEEKMPESDPVKVEEEKQPEPEPEIEKVKYATKLALETQTKCTRAYFTCDALHTLEVAFDFLNEAGEIGTAMGLQYIYGQLQRIAERAIELDDPGLHIPMLLMHMYDGVDDTYGEVSKMKEALKEKEST